MKKTKTFFGFGVMLKHAFFKNDYDIAPNATTQRFKTILNKNKTITLQFFSFRFQHV